MPKTFFFFLGGFTTPKSIGSPSRTVGGSVLRNLNPHGKDYKDIIQSREGIMLMGRNP
jgi:hypothetical protein